MSPPVRLTVNGETVQRDIAPRTHLADFLREHLRLTGTHLGCEHGVCGACTVLLDEVPVRACITFAADCEGRAVRSIEGLEHDPLMVALRAAFTAEHALQCGYCTPGMLVTARDIVQRLPGADDDGIRLELAGNLCRCTGYTGIVRAIRRVLDDPPAAPAPVPAALVVGAFPVPGPDLVRPTRRETPAGPGFALRTRLDLPIASVWNALQDPTLIASCLPGATLSQARDGHIAGTLSVALGPIRARFTGQARIDYDNAHQSGTIAGDGHDAASGTRLDARAAFAVAAETASSSVVTITIDYALQGRLAQFARASVLQAVAAEMVATVGHTLEARLRGDATAVAPPARLGAGRMLLRALWRWLRAWDGRS